MAFGGNMNELHHFKKYLEEELRLAFSRSNPIESRDKSFDVNRITEIQNAIVILGEYEHFVVNCNR